MIVKKLHLLYLYKVNSENSIFMNECWCPTEGLYIVSPARTRPTSGYT